MLLLLLLLLLLLNTSSMYMVIQVIICPIKNCDISAKNEAMHAVNIQEVTSLADSYD